MGILDNVLRPHLEVLTKFYKADELMYMSSYLKKKIEEIADSEKNAKLKRLRLNNESEDFRQLGNNAYKAKDFNQALQMYTKSIAAAIEGPLASLAYFNRWIFYLAFNYAHCPTLCYSKGPPASCKNLHLMVDGFF
jgi:hypothetical protein